MLPAGAGHPAMPYLLFLPSDYPPLPGSSGSTPHTSRPGFPLMVFLHGASEAAPAPLSAVTVNGPPNKVMRHKDFPFVLVSPQVTGPTWGSQTAVAAVLALVDHMISKYAIDPARVILTGISMGGNGVWTIGAARPATFAGLVPICGWGSTEGVVPLAQAKVPVWAFHGRNDETIPVRKTEEMIAALREAGGIARATIYHNSPAPAAYPELVGHASWLQAYEDVELFRWMLARRSGMGAVVPA